MKTALLGALVATLFSVQPNDGAFQKAILGTWKLEKYECKDDFGREFAKFLLREGYEIEFTQAKIIHRVKKVEISWTYKLSTKDKPHQIELVDKDLVQFGIIKIEDSKLFLCIPATSENNRPTEFKVESNGAHYVVYVLSRKGKP